MTHHPRIASLDTETYGACERTDDGRPLPLQTTFHPKRSLHTDRVPLQDLVLCVALTLPVEDPRCPGQTSSSLMTTRTPLGQTWDGSLLSRLVPGSTLLFRMDRPAERDLLRAWLLHLDTLLLMNGPFDLMYLRAWPDFRYVLDGRHFCIDVSHLNYLESEVRPERSLKTMGPVLRTHRYEEGDTLKGGLRFPHPSWVDPKKPGRGLHPYCGSDTHNTMLAGSELARRIVRRWWQCSTSSATSPLPSSSPSSPSVSSTGSATSSSGTAKLSPFCLRFYNDTIWSVVRMSEAGLPFSIPQLEALQARLTSQADQAKLRAERDFGLILEGPGSSKSKAAFLDRVIDIIDGVPPRPAPSLSGSSTQPALSATPEGMQAGAAPSTLSSANLKTPSKPTTSTARSVRDHPLLQLTEKTRAVSVSEENRRLLGGLLPPGHELHGALEAWLAHTQAQKLISSYTFKLLHHRRNDPDDRASTLIRQPGDAVGMSYPTWFIVPSPAKDSGGGEGGTLQARITCKNGSHQTDPPQIKECRCSRFGPDEGVLATMDIDQAELRSGTVLSGDEGMLAEYRKPKPDLHGARAIQVFGPDVVKRPGYRSGDMRIDPRQWGKQFNFADFFLASAARMQRTILELSGQLMPLDFFLNIERTRPQQRPGLWAWQVSLAESAERDGHLILPFTGQSRAFLGFKIDQRRLAKGELKGVGRGSGDEAGKNVISEIVNFPVQASAGNTLLRIQACLHQTLPSINHPDPPCFMCLNTYDALTFDCRRSFLPNLRGLIDEAVTHVATNDYWAWLCAHTGNHVPLKYDLKVHDPLQYKEAA